MSEPVATKVYKLYQADMRVRGLRSRLDAAERFLGEQTRQLGEIGQRAGAVAVQLKQLKASAANDEGELKQIEQHIDELRERMNTSTNNREYKAVLAEVNNFKEKKAEIEERALTQLEQIETLEAQHAELDSSKAEREKMRDVADRDREARAAEIKDKLAEAEAARAEVAAEVPADALAIYEELASTRGEDAVAPLQVIDAKRHEYVCGSTMMSVPMNIAISLLNGHLTLSPNDGCILYLEPEDAERLLAATGKK